MDSVGTADMRQYVILHAAPAEYTEDVIRVITLGRYLIFLTPPPESTEDLSER